jgi:GNAT superfamily N-acetyltransferase
MQADDDVEIVHFGLLPRFIGQRLGGYLLSAGVQYAWEQGARRVWVHTCSLDGPNAMANYRARGFGVYEEKLGWEDLPEVSPGPWPGAGLPPPSV